MAKEYHYVTQEDSVSKSIILLGYNLTEVEKNQLFYSLGKNSNSARGHKETFDDHLSNSYGVVKKKFRNVNEAFKEIITKPQEFNQAIELLKKFGYAVSKKKNISAELKVVSYQTEELGAWK